MAKRVIRLVRLQKTRFKETEGGIEFQWTQPTHFPLSEMRRRNVLARLPDEFLALCYSRSMSSPRVDAVDIVYQQDRFGRAGLQIARLLGDTAKYPLPVAAECEVLIRAEALAAPRITMRIEVVEHEGEPLFSADGVLFDSLDCEQYYCDGVLSIYRGGALFDKTSWIQEYGTHGACPCFMGLANLFPANAYHGDAVSGIDAEDCLVGDVLVLEFSVPLDVDYSFGEQVRLGGSMRAAITSAFEDQQELSIDELGRRLGEGVERTIDEFLATPVVRFNAVK